VPYTQYQFPTNGKQPVILGPKGTPYSIPTVLSSSAPLAATAAASYKSPMMASNLFDDHVGYMAFHNHTGGGFDFTTDHLGGDTDSHV
jgi:hypothetical protein